MNTTIKTLRLKADRYKMEVMMYDAIAMQHMNAIELCNELLDATSSQLHDNIIELRSSLSQQYTIACECRERARIVADEAECNLNDAKATANRLGLPTDDEDSEDNPA